MNQQSVSGHLVLAWTQDGGRVLGLAPSAAALLHLLCSRLGYPPIQPCRALCQLDHPARLQINCIRSAG